MVKTHHALVMDRGVRTINVDATSGAIYIVRNPLDVAISFAHHMNDTIDTAIEEMATDNLETGVNDRSVYEVYGSWSQHVESWTRKTHRTIYVMRYENMLADPMRVFGGLARHLLLQPTEEHASSGNRTLIVRYLAKAGTGKRLSRKARKGRTLLPRRQSGPMA